MDMNKLLLRPITPLSLLLVLVLLAGCGGGGAGADAPPTDSPQDRSVRLAVSRPGELAGYVQGRLRARGNTPGPASSTVVLAPSATAAPPPRSETTVQETGVDEPDLLQSDGQALYTLRSSAGKVEVDSYTRDAAGRAVKLKTVALPAEDAITTDAGGMVLGNNHQALAAITQRWHRTDDGGVICPDICPALAASIMPTMLRSSVAVQRLDVSDPAAPRVGTSLSLDGYLLASRRVGDTLVLVTRHWPRLPIDALPSGASAAERETAIARTTAADVLPKLRRNGGAATALLSDTDCWTQPANGSTLISVTTVTLLDLRAADLAPKSRCFVGGSEALYMTPQHLYLATTRWPSYNPAANFGVARPADIRTDIHKFVLSADDVSYLASGDVAGHLGWSPDFNSYRFSEWNGDLRVITYTASVGWWWTGANDPAATAQPPSPARLTVLRERSSDQTLQTLATLPNSTHPEPLGKPGEQVRAVRFIGERGYVVTFRTVDPLYVLDLADPANPKVAGTLEVPGFSDQLLPMNDGLLLGVGRAVTEAGRLGGVKLSLFDVADPAHPRELSSSVLGAAGSYTALDSSPHGINWLVMNGVARVALPSMLTVIDRGLGLQGLLRVEVDLAARTLKAREPLDVSAPRLGDNINNDRSLQIGNQVYYSRNGSLSTYDW
jgi:Beta propeller domain